MQTPSVLLHSFYAEKCPFHFKLETFFFKKKTELCHKSIISIVLIVRQSTIIMKVKGKLFNMETSKLVTFNRNGLKIHWTNIESDFPEIIYLNFVADYKIESITGYYVATRSIQIKKWYG